jgi:demethylmenaquinone methyltransferase / 2-methoxy-6-polyprenyl-1,4-benzoquinol methylase
MKNGMIESTYTDDKAEKYYAWRAPNYDDLAEWEKEFHVEAVQIADAQEGQRVLVVACGTGRGMTELAQAVGPTGRVDALDLSEQMIEQARAKSEALGLEGRVYFKQGNAKELPYPDETFDIVYNGYMFDLIALDGFDPILKEMQRVLKPGGKLVLLNMSKPDEKKTFYETIYKWTGIPCRPVLMAPYLRSLGFTNVQRTYRILRPHNFYERIVGLLWGQEIVFAQKEE